MNYRDIILNMPYGPSFLFVDNFISINEERCIGEYTFKSTEYFYDHHFRGHPVTPGAILIETMAQIGLVGFGIYLTQLDNKKVNTNFVFTSSDVNFLKPVYPEEKVTVVSDKIYFRLNKLKCRCKMMDLNENIICQGTLSGMQLNQEIQ